MGTYTLGSKRQQAVPSFPGNKYYSKSESEARFIDQNELNTTLLNYLYLPGRVGGQTVYDGVNIIGTEDDTQFLVMASGLESTGVFSSFINSSSQNVMSLVSYPNGMGGNNRTVVIGDAPTTIDPLSRIRLVMHEASDYGVATATWNTGLGITSTANFIAGGDKTTIPVADYVPTYSALFGHTNSNWADPSYTLFNADSGFAYSSDGDFFVGAGRGGNLYLFAGSILDKTAIKGAVLSDGHVVFGAYINTVPAAKLEVQGDAYFKNAVGIGTPPDPTNFNFSIYSAISAGISIDAGTLYNIIYFKRGGVPIAYEGLGSATDVDYQFATYAGLNASIKFVPGGTIAFYMGDETKKHIWTQYTDATRLFSIGLPLATNPTAKFQVSDRRDGSTDRDLMIIDHTATWTNFSTFLKGKDENGNIIFAIGVRGNYYQVKSGVVNTVDATPYPVTLLTLTANKVYKMRVFFTAKQSGDTNGASGEFIVHLRRLSTGGAVKLGEEKSSGFYRTNKNWNFSIGVSGNDVTATVTGAASAAVTWQIWATYEINS